MMQVLNISLTACREPEYIYSHHIKSKTQVTIELVFFNDFRLWSFWNFKERIWRHIWWALLNFIWQGKCKRLSFFLARVSLESCRMPYYCSRWLFLPCARTGIGGALRRWNFLAIRVPFSTWKHVMGVWSSKCCNLGDILYNVIRLWCSFNSKALFVYWIIPEYLHTYSSCHTWIFLPF